jgi:transcriptional regulator with XRE-family HTH domain
MPQSRDPKLSPPAYLGKKLRQGRTVAGFASQDALAAKLGFDRTVITKAETGDRVPTDTVLEAWCEACGLDLELFTELAELARASDGPVPTWFTDWLDAEREAHTIRSWQPIIVPGLLQTPDYARALFVAAGAEDDRADALVTARIERQAILDRADPPGLWFVLDETVLHRRVGSETIMHDQLAHLAELSQRQNVGIQVVPAACGANAGCVGALTVASVDGAPDVLLTETVEDVTTERRPLLRKALEIFDRVRYDALPRTASLELITEVAEQWKR